MLHPRVVGKRKKEFERALRAGALSSKNTAASKGSNAAVLLALMEQAKQRATRPISLRIPIGDIELSKQIAARSGIGYQTVLKNALHEGLKSAKVL